MDCGGSVVHSGFVVVRGGLMSWFVVVCSGLWWFNVMVRGGL